MRHRTVAAGLTGLVLALPGAAPVLAACAGCYILYLAWKVATAPPLGRLESGAARPALLGGYAMAVMNPKAYAAFIALFSGYPLIDLAQRRVRLLWRRRIDARANAPLLRTGFHRRHFVALQLLFARLTDQLLDRRHMLFPPGPVSRPGC